MLQTFARAISFFLFISFLASVWTNSSFAQSAPYPPSSVITGVNFDFSTHTRLAPGSDNWPITWAEDDHQYTCWGDGGGFGGTNFDGRVSLGFARIEGGSDNYQGINVWGGKSPENPAQFDGKSYGIISVEGVLYAWWGPGSGNLFASETRVLRSTDHAGTWTKSDWRWTSGDSLHSGSFLNFGKDNAGARDDFVYSYFPRGSSWELHKPGKADLARVPKDQIMNQAAYEFFAGFDANGNPTWTKNLTVRQPVFEDPNGVRTVSVTYNPALQRYLLTSQHTQVGHGNFGIFEAPEPWGPWSTVDYITNWQNGTGQEIQGVISFYFSPKWFSSDGLDFTLIFTDSDHWATVRGSFTVALTDNTPPSIPANLQATNVSESAVDLLWSAATDPDSGILSYNVYRDGFLIGTTSSTNFYDTGLNENTAYEYQVTAVNGAAMEGLGSNLLTVTTARDITRPAITSVAADAGKTQVAVAFSEVISRDTAKNIANYAIDNNITVMGASLAENAQMVILATSSLSEGITYTLTINGVEDVASIPNVILPDSQMTFSVLVTPTEELVGYWKFNGDASDSAGMNHGTVNGPESYATGKVGQALDFDGTYVNINSNTSINDITALTYSAWIFPHLSGDREIISIAGSARELRLGGDDSSLYLRGCIVASGGNACSNSADGSIRLNTWQHVAMTYDHAGDRKVRLFIDGVEVTYTIQTIAGSGLGQVAGDINIGRRTSGDRFFDGSIDEFQIYGRALSAEEIQVLATTGITPGAVPPPPSGLQITAGSQ